MRRDPLGGDEDPDRPRDGQPPPVADLIASLASQRGWDRRLEGARVHDAWPEVAGPELAEHVWPVRLHGGVLVLQAASPAWATQIRYLSSELVRRANEVLGDGHVKQVRVVTDGGNEEPRGVRGRRGR